MKSIWTWRDYRRAYALHVIVQDEARKLWLCPLIPSGWLDRSEWYATLEGLEQLAPADQDKARRILETD